VANISMNLTIGGGLIQGRVTRSDEGQPVVGAFVAIRGPFPRTTSVSPASVQTNAQGDFSFPGLPPGRYAVEADRIQAVNGTAFDDGSYAMDGLPPGRYLISVQTENMFVWSAYPAELTVVTATVIDVTTGDANGINLVLPNNAGTITGLIKRSDNGQPVMGAS